MNGHYNSRYKFNEGHLVDVNKIVIKVHCDCNILKME